MAIPSSIQIVASIANEASGPSYSVRRLSESLIDQGAAVALAALRRGMTAPQDQTHLKLFEDGIGPRKLGRSPAMAQWLTQAAPEVDVVHSHGLWMMPNIYAGRAAARAKAPLVISPRGTLSEYAFASGSVVKPLFWHLLQKHSMRQAACFHATGQPELEDIRRMGYGQPVALIPNGIDIPEIDRDRPASGDMRQLLYFGRLHPEKGLEPLLEAWAKVAPDHPDWELSLVGPDIDGYRGILEAKAAALNLPRLRFGDPVYGAAEKTALYDTADLYVLPSPSENFGMTVAEALSCGVPVLTTTGTPWNALPDEAAGWYVTPDPAGLAQGLAAGIKASDEERAKKGARGRAWMERDFSWAGIATKTIDVYAWLLGKGPRPDCVSVET